MEKKRKGWKEGILTRELVSQGGHTYPSGSVVRYRKVNIRWNPIKKTNVEYQYVDQDNMNLICTTELYIAPETT
jgi:hypothetical protein